MPSSKIMIDVDHDDIRYLRLLASEGVPAGEEVSSVLKQLISSVVDGMRRPGAWERGVVAQLFNNEFMDKLMPDPKCEWHQIPRDAGGPN